MQAPLAPYLQPPPNRMRATLGPSRRPLMESPATAAKMQRDSVIQHPGVPQGDPQPTRTKEPQGRHHGAGSAVPLPNASPPAPCCLPEDLV